MEYYTARPSLNDQNDWLNNKEKFEISVLFPLNSEVFYMDNNEVKCDRIRGINLKLDVKFSPSIEYFVGIDRTADNFYDGRKLFKTKQELLDSL